MALLLLVLAMLAVTVPPAASSGRHARNLIFVPNGSRLQMIVGFGIPLNLPHQAVTMGYVFKTNYVTPFNSTHYTNPVEAFASSRSLRAVRNDNDHQVIVPSELTDHLPSRWHLYDTMQVVLEQIGAGPGNGRTCLLRAICEAAAFSLKHNGLLGELLHVMLTPSSTREPVLRHEDYQFHAAEREGRQARDARDPVDTCARVFGGCATTTLDLFTRMLPF